MLELNAKIANTSSKKQMILQASQKIIPNLIIACFAKSVLESFLKYYPQKSEVTMIISICRVRKLQTEKIMLK